MEIFKSFAAGLLMVALSATILTQASAMTGGIQEVMYGSVPSTGLGQISCTRCIKSGKCPQGQGCTFVGEPGGLTSAGCLRCGKRVCDSKWMFQP